MKISTYFFVFFCLPRLMLSQSAVLSSGGSASSSGGSVSYSVGQIAYESYGDSNYQITEGVQQVFIINILGCTSSDACNYDSQATVDNGNCLFVGDACDDNNASTSNDSIAADCSCMGVILSVETEMLSGIQMFPNPTSQQLRIKSPGNQIIQAIELHDMNGQRVMSEKPLSSDIQLNVSSLAAGQYMVEVRTANGMRRVPIQIIR